MLITDLTLTLFRRSLPHTRYTHIGALGGENELAVLTVHTDEGVEGHALLGSASRSARFDTETLLTILKPVVVGRNPLDIGRQRRPMWRQRNRGATLRGIAAVDIALWDVAGKVMGRPVHRLLGTCRDRVPAYA